MLEKIGYGMHPMAMADQRRPQSDTVTDIYD